MQTSNNSSVQLKDVTDDWACLSLWGPQARKVLEAVTQSDVTNEAFPYMTAQIIPIAASDHARGSKLVEAWAQRVSYAGELGWELYIDNDEAAHAWDALMAAGEVWGIRPVGYKALDTLRLEKGYRMWGSDITPDENPFEAGLGFCVRLKSGADFIGREALMRLKQSGQGRRLCTLTIEDDSCVIYGGEAIYAEADASAGKQPVGRVRSGGYGYTVGTNIALSYLPVDLAVLGTEVQVEIFGELIPTRVVPDALYDPQGGRLRI
jgi:4-methylaminobutanoate oxidase (formaldehyde-forming)